MRALGRRQKTQQTTYGGEQLRQEMRHEAVIRDDEVEFNTAAQHSSGVWFNSRQQK